VRSTSLIAQDIFWSGSWDGGTLELRLVNAGLGPVLRVKVTGEYVAADDWPAEVGTTGPPGPTGTTGTAGAGMGGSCTGNHALQSVNADGSVNCVAFTPSGRVLTAGEFLPASGDPPVTIFSIDGTVVRGVCTADGHAQVTIGAGPGSIATYSSDSSSLGHKFGQPSGGSSQVIADQAAVGVDRAEFSSIGTFTASTFLSGTVYAEAPGSGCVFQGSAIAANGPPPPAGLARVGRTSNPHM
jgi:hypothetical protein